MSPEERVAVWDAEAQTYDEPADHGLRDPAVRQSWRRLLTRLLPPPPSRVADLGCGTGTLELLSEAAYWGAPISDERYVVVGRQRA